MGKGKSGKNFKLNGPVKAKKHLGQHFLTDEEVAQNIAATLSFEGYNNVLEIGPGTGVLTKYILQKNTDLVAMDLDRESIAYLKDTFPLENILDKKGRLTVLEADFLKYDLSTLFKNHQFAITGNFPYNISTQIVFKMLEVKERVPEFSGMFQKEVAQRICAKEGNKTYGILSVYAQAFYDAEYLFTVPPQVFEPTPKVDSGVLRLKRKKNFRLSVDESLFLHLIKTSFNQRRKTLRNSLKSFALSEELRSAPVFDKRPEQLSVQQFIGLTEKIQREVQ